MYARRAGEAVGQVAGCWGDIAAFHRVGILQLR